MSESVFKSDSAPKELYPHLRQKAEERAAREAGDEAGHAPDADTASVDTARESLSGKSPGVARIEAIVTAWKRWHHWFMWSALCFMAYYRNLDQLTRPTFQAHALSSWGVASSTATLAVIRATIVACNQPVYAKLSNYVGRTFVLGVGTLLFIIGSLIQATATHFSNYLAGFIIYTLGFGGQGQLFSAVTLDSSSMRNRVLMLQVQFLPALINVWVSGTVAQKMLDTIAWRWGFAIPLIVVPVITVPLFAILMYGRHRAAKQGLLHGIPTSWELLRTPQLWVKLLVRTNLIGLLLLSATIALILIPLTLGEGESEKWTQAKILAPIAAFAKYPIVPLHLLKRRHVWITFIVCLSTVASSATQGSYLYFTMLVPFGKSVEAATRVRNLARFSKTLLSIGVGLAVRRFRYLKPFIIFGALLNTAAFAVLLRYRGGHKLTDFAGAVAGEVLLGAADAFMNSPLTAILHAVVSHEHMAVMSAAVQCCFQVGAAIGGALAGGIWTNTMPKELNARLLAAGFDKETSAKHAKAVFGNPVKWIAKYGVGTPERVAVDGAYREVQKWLCLCGILVSGVLMCFTFFMDNPRLGDSQSNVPDEDVPPVALKEDMSVHEEQTAPSAGQVVAVVK